LRIVLKSVTYVKSYFLEVVKLAKFYTPGDVCAILQIKNSHLRYLRYKNLGPPFQRFGHRTIRYPKTEFEAWLAQKDSHEDQGEGRRQDSVGGERET
jgi:hypothetical protein